MVKTEYFLYKTEKQAKMAVPTTAIACKHREFWPEQ
jgi:hypothetical protein